MSSSQGQDGGPVNQKGGGEPSPFEFMNECKAATSSAPEIPRREGGDSRQEGEEGGGV
jgi:hypothetical protein